MAGVSELTITELELKYAQLKRQAAEARGRWRSMSSGPVAVAAGKRVKDLDARAHDYYTIILMVQAMASGKVKIPGG